MKIYIFILFVVLLASCTGIKELSGHTYSYHSRNRTLQLVFRNDTICEVQNRFYCKDIPIEYQLITFVCRYMRIGEELYLENTDKTVDKNCIVYYIPPQNSKECSFLNGEARERKNILIIGPNYVMPYKLYGMVPNITSEKLWVGKKTIWLVKEINPNSKLGFIFKRNSLFRLKSTNKKRKRL